MKYIKHPTTNEIVKGKAFGEAFKNYKKCTQAEINNYELGEEKKQRIATRKAYLDETDWHVAKSIDTGVAYAQEVKDKRALARQEINEIELADETTINDYLITF